MTLLAPSVFDARRAVSGRAQRRAHRSLGSAALFVAASFSIYALPLELQAQQPRTLAGVIVDADTGDPVPDVVVRIDGTDLQVLSDSAGRFRMPGVPMGSHRLVLRHIAYGEHSRALTLDEASTVDFRVRISRQAIELAPLEVEVRSDAELARLASGNRTNVVERPTIEAFAKQGASLVYMLESEVPGIRVNGPCVEFRLQARSGSIGRPDPDMPGLSPGGANINSTCRALTLYVDGTRSSEDLLQISLDELERVQVLSSSEAGVRYGLAGGAGVILLETRRGVAPGAPAPIVKVTGFAWQEPSPYPWARVLATSFAGVAANVALTYVGVGSCVHDELNDVKLSKCGSVIPSVAGLMTGTVSSLMTSWAGKTTLSRGRALPSLAAGALSAVTGYVLYSKGEDRGSSSTQAAGLVTLTIGTPALLVLTDRVFRQLR